MMKVWVCLEGPDMTYYGDAELHGIYERKESAEAAARGAAAGRTYPWNGDAYDSIKVFEIEVEP